MKTNAFLQRVQQRLPRSSPHSYRFENWEVSGQPTKEGLGILPVSDVDPEKLIQCVMDVNNYVGNIDYVEECRSIQDSRFETPEQVRFYQRIKIPIIGSIHHELVLTDLGEQDGLYIAFWELLERETNALSKRTGYRSQYSDGAWIAGKGMVGYALRSAPRRDDVGFLKFKAMTKGADVSASSVIQSNIEAMCRWSRRRR